MFDLADTFENALPYNDFLAKYGTPDQQTNWARFFDTVQLTGVQQQLLSGFQREMRVLCMAGAWCGDCVQQCPIFKRFADVAGTIDLRFVDRDENEQLKNTLTICGGARVPQVVFLSEENKPVGWYGDKTLARYRSLAERQIGESCSTGIAGAGDEKLEDAIVQDWLNEFERVQLILRLSPSLRRKHDD